MYYVHGTSYLKKKQWKAIAIVIYLELAQTLDILKQSEKRTSE